MDRARASQHWQVIGLWAGIVLITAAVFSPVLGHHFLETWDDKTTILTNPDYLPPRLGNLAHYWELPSPVPLFAPVTYSLWGLIAMAARHSAPAGLPFNPAWFHAESLVAHALSAGFAFLCLRRLVRSRWAAWLGAAVFALHPIQVESVSMAWTVYTPLCGMFGLLALWQYLVYSDKRFGGSASAGWGNYALATAAFVLGLLSKPQVVPLPLMAAAIEVGLRGRKPRQLLPLLPWLVLALLDVWANRLSSKSATVFLPENWQLPIIALDAIAFYLWKVCLPIHLTLDYGRSPSWVTQHPEIWLTVLLPIVIAIGCWVLRRRVRWIITSMAVFALALLPTLGLVPFDFQIYSTVSDRFAYLAMLGPAMFVAFAIQMNPKWFAPLAAALLLVLGGLSVIQLRYWQDDWKLTAHLLEENPRSKGAVDAFRYLYSRKGHLDPPSAPFPASSHCSLDRATLLQLGDELRQRKQLDLAEDCYQQAMREGPEDESIYLNLGATLLMAQEPDRAMQAFREALRLRPEDPAARAGLQKAIEAAAATEPSPP